MAVPRKGRQTASVDGVKYCFFADSFRISEVVVRRADNAGANLFILGLEYRVSRKKVERAIHYALQHDWNDLAAKKVDYWIDVKGDFRILSKHQVRGIMEEKQRSAAKLSEYRRLQSNSKSGRTKPLSQHNVTNDHECAVQNIARSKSVFMVLGGEVWLVKDELCYRSPEEGLTS